jgi:hypothetical protein
MNLILERVTFQLEAILALRNRLLTELRSTELDLPGYRELCSVLEIFEAAQTELARVTHEGSAEEQRVMIEHVAPLVAATPVEELRSKVRDLIALVDRFAELPPEVREALMNRFSQRRRSRRRRQ